MQSRLSAAFSRKVQTEPQVKSLALQLFSPELDTAFTSPDGRTAVLWIRLRDSRGNLLATEPGLALALLLGGSWQVLLPGEPGWKETLAALPVGMLPLELSPAPLNIWPASPTAAEALTGYYLPYAGGTARWLEGSISHFQSIPELGYPSCDPDYCQYAYDFTDSGHFPIVASKDGVVVAARDSCTDGNPGCTNYIVLFNNADQAYQIYLHLAYGTVPDSLGADTGVQRGQYLGDSDDTGYSTSQHVHFMVTRSIWVGGDGYYWGNSIDIRFADVAINGGIPRTCYEVTSFLIYDGATECNGNKSDPRNPANDWFTSGNTGAFPPTGALTRPAGGAVVAVGSNPLMDITATASDDVAVSAVRLVAKINNQWVEIGPKVSQPAQPGVYDWDLNLCLVGPLNGPLEVALRIWDHEGNVAAALSPRTIQVDYACPPSTSQLNPAQGFDSTAVSLSWDAADGGAGFGSFDLQWRVQSGTWNTANTLTVSGSARSAWFVGQLGGAYDFRLRAVDGNGQLEPWPANLAAETSFTAPGSCVPDVFEPDDDVGHARVLALSVWAQSNLCGVGNADWYRVEIPKEGHYFVIGSSLTGGAAVKVRIFAANGTTLLTSAQADGVGQNAMAKFTPPGTGIYYLKVEPLLPDLVGTAAVYRVWVSEAKEVFLPRVER